MKTKSIPARQTAKAKKLLVVNPLEFPSLAFPPGRMILSVPEIAGRLGVTRAHVYALIEDGSLQAINTGGTGRYYWRVPLEAFNDFIRRNHSYVMVCRHPACRRRR